MLLLQNPLLPSMPSPCLKVEQATPARRQLQLEKFTEARLRAFFRPYNEHLYRLAGQDFGWERRPETSWISAKLAAEEGEGDGG